MILDLEKVAQIEKKYQNNPVALDAFRIMVQTIASSPNYNEIGLNTDFVALETLNDLECIKKTSKKTPQQLNS